MDLFDLGNQAPYVAERIAHQDRQRLQISQTIDGLQLRQHILSVGGVHSHRFETLRAAQRLALQLPRTTLTASDQSSSRTRLKSSTESAAVRVSCNFLLGSAVWLLRASRGPQQ